MLEIRRDELQFAFSEAERENEKLRKINARENGPRYESRAFGSSDEN